MINKGVVYEVLKSSSVVLNSKGEFVFVKNDKNMAVGQVIQYRDKDVISPRKRIYQFASIGAAIAAVFVVLFIVFGAGLKPNPEYAYVDVDVNPSIEFVINRDYKVLKAIPLNVDGKKILDDIDCNNKHVDNAVTELINQSRSHGYLKNDEKNVVLISAALNSNTVENSPLKNVEEEKLNTILDSVANAIKESTSGEVVGKTILASSKVREEAKVHQISMGKYSLYLKSKEMGLAVSIDKIKSTSIKDLLKDINIDSIKITSTPKQPNKQTPSAIYKPNPKSTPTSDGKVANQTTAPGAVEEQQIEIFQTPSATLITATPSKPAVGPTPVLPDNKNHTPYDPVENIPPQAKTIPGMIEAENYDDMIGIRTQPCHEGGENIAYLDVGDWIQYKGYVKKTGTYQVEFRVSSTNQNATLDLKSDDNVLTSVKIPHTGDWQNYMTVSATVSLTAGVKDFYIYTNDESFNLNWFKFTFIEASNSQQTKSQVAILPGKIEAENYASMSGIGIDACEEGGKDITDLDSGDWADYKVNVQKPGSYQVELRVISPIDKAILELKLGQMLLGSIKTPHTEGQKYVTVTTEINLSSGPQVIKLFAVKGGCKINWIKFSYVGSINTSKFNGYYRIVNRFSKKTAIPEGASSNNKVRIIQGNYSGSAYGEWEIIGIGDGYYKIINHQSNKVLTGGNVHEAVTQSEYMGSQNQQWQIIYLGDGCYDIINRSNGKYLDNQFYSAADGTPIILSEKSSKEKTERENQVWHIVKADVNE